MRMHQIALLYHLSLDKINVGSSLDEMDFKKILYDARHDVRRATESDKKSFKKLDFKGFGNSMKKPSKELSMKDVTQVEEPK